MNTGLSGGAGGSGSGGVAYRGGGAVAAMTSGAAATTLRRPPWRRPAPRLTVVVAAVRRCLATSAASGRPRSTSKMVPNLLGLGFTVVRSAALFHCFSQGCSDPRDRTLKQNRANSFWKFLIRGTVHESIRVN